MKEARGRDGITNYELRSANKKKHKATKMTPKRNKVFAEKKSIIAEAVAKKTLGWCSEAICWSCGWKSHHCNSQLAM